MSVQEYRPAPNVRVIWSPADARQAVDDAELHRLADQIIAAQPVAAELDEPSVFDCLAIEMMLAGRLSTDWPDPIAAKLAQWPAPIIVPVVVP